MASHAVTAKQEPQGNVKLNVLVGCATAAALTGRGLGKAQGWTPCLTARIHDCASAAPDVVACGNAPPGSIVHAYSNPR
jgi:hypothetical protein